VVVEEDTTNTKSCPNLKNSMRSFQSIRYGKYKIIQKLFRQMLMALLSFKELIFIQLKLKYLFTKLIIPLITQIIDFKLSILDCRLTLNLKI
jgi:hypothetical protein